MPAAALTSDAIVHERLAAPPSHRRAAPAPGAPIDPSDRLPERGMDPGAVLLALLGSANLSSRRAVFEQYDSTVGADTVAGPGRGAAVLRIKGTTKALVASTDGNQAVGALDPYLGAALSVAEATRNVAITGARPLGVTNCLNYGDPTRPEAFWQLTEGVRGLGDACRALGLPVTGGNVSLYNESPDGAIAPTPEIGVVGLLEDIGLLVGPAFVAEGDTVVLVGEGTPGLSGSAYAALAGTAAEDGPPALDLAREAALQAFIREAIARELVASAQDVSGGGLAVALAEGAMWSGLGRPGPPGGRDLAGRRAVRREPVAARPDRAPAVRPGVDAARPASTACPSRSSASSAASAWSSSSPVPAPRAPARSAGAASPTRSTCRSPTCATPGTTAWPGRSAGRADGDVRRLRRGHPGRGGHGGGRDRDARPVRAPAPRPGIGRRGGQRRRAADALQGPRA